MLTWRRVNGSSKLLIKVIRLTVAAIMLMIDDNNDQLKSWPLRGELCSWVSVWLTPWCAASLVLSDWIDLKHDKHIIFKTVEYGWFLFKMKGDEKVLYWPDAAGACDKDIQWQWLHIEETDDKLYYTA